MHDSGYDRDSEGYLKPLRDGHHRQNRLDRPSKGSTLYFNDIETWARLEHGHTLGGGGGNSRIFYDDQNNESKDS